MESINLSSKEIVSALLEQGLVLISKKDLQNLIDTSTLTNRVDERKKYVDHQKAIKMFDLTDYWFKQRREDPETLLKTIPGKGKTSPWKYQIDSIYKEQERLSV